MISIIAAMTKSRVIGLNNKIPWSLPADMKRFKELTMGKPVVMGRRTFESIGKPLPGRTNIILTSDMDFKADGCRIVHDVESILSDMKVYKEIMVIGGSSVYEQFLPYADKMYLTLVDGEYEGDAFFPQFNITEWAEIDSEIHKADDENHCNYIFVTLERRVSPSGGGRSMLVNS